MGAVAALASISELGTMDAAAVERLDQVAHRWVGLSLFALAAYVVFEAVTMLWRNLRPEASLVGVGLTGISLFVML